MSQDYEISGYLKTLVAMRETQMPVQPILLRIRVKKVGGLFPILLTQVRAI